MEIRQLRTFIAVVEHGGFRRAASKLHFSQPTVTAHVRELERSLGVRLFERLPGGVRLTPAGQNFFVSAQGLVDLSDAAAAAARQDRVVGTLRVGTFPAAAAELTRPLLLELRRRWPTVDLEVAALDLGAWAPVIAGLDALIMRDPIDLNRVRATELFHEPMLVAVPWQWPASESSRLTTAELLALPLVRLASGLSRELRAFWCVEDLRNGQAIDFRGYGASCAEDVADDIACGFGAALTTKSVLRSVGESNRLWAVPFERSPETHVWMTTRIEDRRPIIDALHREVAAITERIGPLILPELSGSGSPESLQPPDVIAGHETSVAGRGAVDSGGSAVGDHEFESPRFYRPAPH
ncbi:MAG TPA: LysR family transcriptional regulator [Microlunatus sp.]